MNLGLIQMLIDGLLMLRYDVFGCLWLWFVQIHWGNDRELRALMAIDGIKSLCNFQKRRRKARKVEKWRKGSSASSGARDQSASASSTHGQRLKAPVVRVNFSVRPCQRLPIAWTVLPQRLHSAWPASEATDMTENSINTFFISFLGFYLVFGRTHSLGRRF